MTNARFAGWIATLCCVIGAATPARGAAPAGSGSGAAAVKRNFVGDQGLPWFWSFAGNLEAMHNDGGGLRDGTASGDLLNFAFALNGDAIGLPAGSRFKVSAMSASGDFPSRDYVGDAQGVSNIAATPATRVYELWYRQQFLHAPVRLRGGLLDLNQYFDVMASGSNLLNSAFGVNTTLTANVQAPVYPVPGWGIMSRWKRARWQLQGGLFSGAPDERNRLDGRPPLGIVEADFTPPSGSSDSRWMFGVWRKRASRGTTRIGFYACVERSLLSRVRGFLQVGRAPGANSQYGTSVEAGLDVHPWVRRAGDEFSVGLTRQNVRGAPHAENTLEATYVLGISKAVAVQPDLQYVRHPAGELPSTWVLGLRFDIGLDRRSVMTARGKD